MICLDKKREYQNTIDLLDQIYHEQGLYFVLAFLNDAQYDRNDIKNMMEMLRPGIKFGSQR